VPRISGGKIDGQHTLRWLYFKFIQYVALIIGGFGVSENTIFFVQKFSEMKPLHLPADPGPTEAGFRLGNTHQQQRQPAQQYMGAGALIL